MWRRTDREGFFGRNRRFHRTSKNVAKERLRFMMDAQRQRLDEEVLNQIRQEIGNVITKYVDIEPENVEVKVILKDYKKRETYVETI